MTWTEVPVNMPYTDYGDAIKRLNDLTVGKYDVFVVPSSIGPTNKAVEQQRYLDLYSMGIIDKDMVIRHLDIPEKEELLTRMSQMAQMQQVIEMLKQYIAKLESDKESLENMVVREKVYRKAAQVGADLEKMKAEIQAQMKLHGDRYAQVVEQKIREEESSPLEEEGELAGEE
jgi:hypothetical protein